MRISKAQTRENKARIVAAAAQLFRERGFERVGVAEVMQAAGLTHGGFYNHFDSKKQLEEEACTLSFGEALGPLSRIGELDSRRQRRTAFAAYVEGYLRQREPAGSAPRCPFVSDICITAPPPLATLSPVHASRCIRAPLERLVS